MKTLILIMICIMMFGAASNAQVDTSRNRLQQDTSRNRTGIRSTPTQPAPIQTPTQPTVQPQAVPTQQQPVPQVNPQTNPANSVNPTNPTNPTNPANPTGWTPLSNQNVPDNLRQTLSTTPQYQGWENGSLYTNPTNGMYQLRTSDLNNPQVYYFDKNGKVTTAPPHD